MEEMSWTRPPSIFPTDDKDAEGGEVSGELGHADQAEAGKSGVGRDTFNHHLAASNNAGADGTRGPFSGPTNAKDLS
jgi:hypothetical protein